MRLLSGRMLCVFEASESPWEWSQPDLSACPPEEVSPRTAEPSQRLARFLPCRKAIWHYAIVERKGCRCRRAILCACARTKGRRERV